MPTLLAARWHQLHNAAPSALCCSGVESHRRVTAQFMDMITLLPCCRPVSSSQRFSLGARSRSSLRPPSAIVRTQSDLRATNGNYRHFQFQRLTGPAVVGVNDHRDLSDFHDPDQAAAVLAVPDPHPLPDGEVFVFGKASAR